MPGLLVETLHDRRDVGAADAYIGKRAVVERHQLAIGALAVPPPAPGVARRNEEVDSDMVVLLTLMVHCKKMGILALRTIQKIAIQPCTGQRDCQTFEENYRDATSLVLRAAAR